MQYHFCHKSAIDFSLIILEKLCNKIILAKVILRYIILLVSIGSSFLIFRFLYEMQGLNLTF